MYTKPKILLLIVVLKCTQNPKYYALENNTQLPSEKVSGSGYGHTGDA